MDQCMWCDHPLTEEEGEICDICLEHEAESAYYEAGDWADDDE